MPDDYDDYDALDDLGEVEEDQGAGYYEDEELDPDELSAIDEDDRDASYYEYMWGGPEDEELDEELEAYESPDDLDDVGEDDLSVSSHSRTDDKVMAAEAQRWHLQWFYDDAGYYSYVLLNAPEELFKRVQQVLRSEGLRVPLAGRSYRPASNGVRYQWYIRVSDESGRHPDRKRINEILAGYAVREVRSVSTEPAVRNRIAELEKEVERQKGVSQILAQRLGSLRVAYERSQQELQNYRERISYLEQLLSQIQKAALTSEDATKIRQHYERTIQELKQEIERREQDLQNVRQELNEYLENFDLENRELRNRLAIVEGEKRQLEEQLSNQVQEMRREQSQGSEKGNAEQLFRELLGLFLPHVEFLDGALDTLWREMRDPIGVLADLTRLGDLKAKRVRNAEEWLERHIDDGWRLYFRKCENSKYQVLISHKNTQKADIAWLRRQ